MPTGQAKQLSDFITQIRPLEQAVEGPQPDGAAPLRSRDSAGSLRPLRRLLGLRDGADHGLALDIVPTMRLEEKKKKSSGKKSVLPAPVSVQSARAVTVHWDPNSPEGKRVGRRIRIFDPDEGDDGEWREGRVLRYDPASNKHKIQYEDDINDDCCWLRLKHEIVQCGDDLVWCLVKGFAWWPAQILICEPETEMTTKEGCVYVKFFGAEQVAFVKNTPDYVRPFNNGQIDAFIAKNKKKRNAKVRYMSYMQFTIQKSRAPILLDRSI